MVLLIFIHKIEFKEPGADAVSIRIRERRNMIGLVTELQTQVELDKEDDDLA